MIHLETDRIRLRNLVPDDADVLFDYRNHVLCSRYQRGQTKDYEGIVQLIEAHRDDAIGTECPYIMAIACRQRNLMLGEIVVMPKEHCFTIGYTVSYKHQRKGYAYEALSALIPILHEKFPTWEFISFTHPDNEASMALLRKLGYQALGYVPSLQSQAFGKWITVETEEKFSSLKN